MSFANREKEFNRKGLFLVKIKQDLCENTHGSAPCEASGTPYCYYTYITCKDKAHYSRGIKEYRFSMNEGVLVADALPLVEKIKFIKAEIDLENFKTVRGNLVIHMLDDIFLPLANPDKSVTNVETAGTFWKNWKARNDNYERRIVELWRGFLGLDESEWKLEFRGVIDRIEPVGKGRQKIIVKDLFRKLDMDSHRGQDEDTFLTQAYSGGAEIHVSDATKFAAEIYGNYSYIDHEIVKLGESRYARFSGRDTSNPNDHKLTGAGWVYGSSDEAAAEEEVHQVLVYAKDYGYGPDQSEGIPPDSIFMDLFYRAGVDMDCIYTIDRGITLTSGISDTDVVIPVSAVNLPQEGIVKVEDELIKYYLIIGQNLQVKKRGAYGTTKASHASGKSVDPVSFTDELNRWIANMLYRRVITDPLKIQELIVDLCRSSQFMIFQNEDQKLQGRAITPPWWDETIPELTDQDILEDSIGVNENEAERRTRTVMMYSPLKNDPGDKTDDWARSWWYVDMDMEGANHFGFVKDKNLKAPFTYRSVEADAVTALLQAVFSPRAEILKFQTDPRTNLKLASLFRMTTDEIVAIDGTPEERILMQVLSKILIENKGKNAYEYDARRLAIEGRFGLIAPDYPTLTSNITSDQTDIQATISIDTFQFEEIRPDGGQVQIEGEEIDYDSCTKDDDTHITFHGCVRDGDKAAHSAGAWVMILYPGASDSAREKYAFIGDADNMLDSDGDGVVDEEGYLIY